MRQEPHPVAEQVAAPSAAWEQLGASIRLVDIEGFVVSLGEGLDRAGDWVSCFDPSCPNRAYLLEFHATRIEALVAALRRGQALAEELIPTRPATLAEIGLPFTVWHVMARRVRACDYREAAAPTEGLLEGLRRGGRHDAAWEMLRDQRVRNAIDGALFRSEGLGTLFLFMSSLDSLAICEPVDSIVWRGGFDMAS